jgi:hypothetical protein
MIPYRTTSIWTMLICTIRHIDLPPQSEGASPTATFSTFGLGFRFLFFFASASSVVAGSTSLAGSDNSAGRFWLEWEGCSLALGFLTLRGFAPLGPFLRLGAGTASEDCIGAGIFRVRSGLDRPEELSSLSASSLCLFPSDVELCRDFSPVLNFALSSLSLRFSVAPPMGSIMRTLRLMYNIGTPGICRMCALARPSWLATTYLCLFVRFPLESTTDFRQSSVLRGSSKRW